MSKKTMTKNNSIGLRFTIAFWWFSVRTAPVMGGCKNETKTKNHGKLAVFPFWEKTKRKRKMGGFSVLRNKREMGGVPWVSLC